MMVRDAYEGILPRSVYEPNPNQEHKAEAAGSRQPDSGKVVFFIVHGRLIGGLMIAYISGKPRKTPVSSTESANSSKPMFAMERLLSIEASCAAIARNSRPRSSTKSTTSTG